MQKYQIEVHEWFERSNWPYWSSLNQYARLVEEMGEVARVLNDLVGEKPKKLDEQKRDLAEEIGDVIYTLVCLANANGFWLRISGSSTQKAKRTPMALFARLSSACGQLADAIEENDREEMKRISDVMIVRLKILADKMGIDFDQAIRKSLDKVTMRDSNRF